MNENFTYETSETKKLETYEWDNLWWEHANDEEGKDRVLLIGDSISCGYRSFVNELLGGEILADSLGTSKSLDNEFFFTLIDYVIRQQKNCRLIQFNNGLHGWHLSVQEYEECYQEFVRFFKEMHSDKKLVLALTTPVRDPQELTRMDVRNEEVILRNQAVRKIAEKEGILINDMYSALIDHPEYYSADGVHLTAEGYKVLAKLCAEIICEE